MAVDALDHEPLRRVPRGQGALADPSEEDHHDPKNFAVAVTEAGNGKFREAKIDDSAEYFKGKTIQVTGLVRLKDNQPQIEVDDPRQIAVV
jgi:hypothetical protein